MAIGAPVAGARVTAQPDDSDSRQLDDVRWTTTGEDGAGSGNQTGLQSVVNMSQMFSGFFSVMPYVRNSFKGPRFDQGYPELYPSFRQLDTGEVVVRAYAKPAASVHPPVSDSVPAE